MRRTRSWSNSRHKRREKGDVRVEKEQERLERERVEKLENFFDVVFSLLQDSESFDATNFRVLLFPSSSADVCLLFLYLLLKSYVL